MDIHNVKTVCEVLAGLKAEIGLNDQDLMIVVFSSIDFDWMTNLLILQDEFLSWFSICFEKDSKEEVSFIERKSDNFQ